MREKQVSVIVPIYNVDKQLIKCLNSIYAQTFTGYELLLVDDGSPDSCAVLCDEYTLNDSRIITIHKSNGGLSDARNAGLNIASKEYVYFCDSDDYIDQNLLLTTVPYFQQGYDSIFFADVEMNESGQIIEAFLQETESITVDEETRIAFLTNILLTCKIQWSVCNQLFKRGIIEEKNIRFFDNKKIFAEDLCFSLSYHAFSSKIQILEDKFYYYCRRESSIMGSQSDKVNLDRMSLMCEAVHDYWSQFPECRKLMECFPAIYYRIFTNQIELLSWRWNNMIKLRKYILQTIPNWDFFKNNMRCLGSCLKYIDPGDNIAELYRKEYEATYWIDGKWITCWLKLFVSKMQLKKK